MKFRTLFIFLIFSSFLTRASAENLSLSFSSGLFLPKQKEFKDMYGPGNPYALEVRALFLKNFGFSMGLEYLSMKGNASGGGEEYPLRFKMTSIPFAAFYRFPLKKILLSFGFGGSYNSFQEKWETVEIDFKEKKWGYLVFSSFEYRLSSKFFVLAKLRYDNIPTKKGSLLLKNVNLGGVKLVAGLGISL